MLKYEQITLTVDASGDLTTYSSAFTGLLHALVYVPGSSGLDTGADLTITDRATGHAIDTITNGGTSTLVKMPRGATSGITDAAALYAAGGTGVFDRLPVLGGLKIVVAQGGTSKTGYIWAVWDECC